MPEGPSNLGQQLRDARAIKHLKLEDVEKQTKIRLRHLAAIEEGHYRELPPDVFAIGFVKRYAKFLGLDPGVAVAMFRQERSLSRSNRPAISFRPPTPLARFPLVISTRLLLSALAVLVVLLLFGYIWWEVRLFAAPPQLNITTPANNSTVQESRLTLTGKTSPTANLFINNEQVLLAEDGSFSQEVKLTPGINAIEVKAVNRLNKEKVEVLYTLYEEPESVAPGV